MAIVAKMKLKSRNQAAAKALSLLFAFVVFSGLLACAEGANNSSNRPSTDSAVGASGAPSNGQDGNESTDKADGVHSGSKGQEAGGSDLLALLDKVTPATESEMANFFQTNCASCHQGGGPNASFWTINFAELDKSIIRADPDAHRVFQAIVNKVEDHSKPTPMPPGPVLDKDSDQLNSFLKVIDWYITDVPEIPINAFLEFGLVNPFGEDVDVTFDYQCKAPVTFRSYLARVTFDAFARAPTEADFALFSDLGIGKNDPVTDEARKEVARTVIQFKPWREEFLEKGLRNFALKLSGAGEIKTSTNPSEYAAGVDDLLKDGLLAEEAADLKEEFYQLIKRNIDIETGAEALKYKDLLLGNKIPATKTTAKMYGCNVSLVGSEKWAECDMSSGYAQRQSYFTSFSYLASKRTSFLIDNNNYGRIATLYYFSKRPNH